MVLLDQIGTIRRWIAVSALVVGTVVLLTMVSGSIALSHADTGATPTGASLTPTACGSPVDSWGAATADDVRVQIVSVERGMTWGITGTPVPSTPLAQIPALTVNLEITNLGQEPVRIDPRDVTLTTCAGKHLAPAVEVMRIRSVLGSFDPAEMRRGPVTFLLDADDSPAHLTVKIQEEHRTGAQIDCPLVLDLGTARAASISAGCNAQGGSGQSGAPGIAGHGVAASPTTAGR